MSAPLLTASEVPKAMCRRLCQNATLVMLTQCKPGVGWWPIVQSEESWPLLTTAPARIRRSTPQSVPGKTAGSETFRHRQEARYAPAKIAASQTGAARSNPESRSQRSYSTPPPRTARAEGRDCSSRASQLPVGLVVPVKHDLTGTLTPAHSMRSPSVSTSSRLSTKRCAGASARCSRRSKLR